MLLSLKAFTIEFVYGFDCTHVCVYSFSVGGYVYVYVLLAAVCTWEDARCRERETRRQ